MKIAASYLKALASLMLAMAVYSLTVVPFIEPGEKAEPLIPPFDRALGGERWWQDFFADGSWQVQDPVVINTDRGILLASSLTQIDSKTLELKPLTIILPHTKTARSAIQEKLTSELVRQEMWIVSAEAGAEIHFQDPLELTSGSLPSVVRGELRGAIEVTRKIAADVGEKPWSIKTHDLSIERRKLSTQREVRIEWNGSIIQGRNLRIMLRGGGLLSDRQSTSSSWGPLDELELYNVDKVDIALPPGGIWANFHGGRFSEEPHLRTLPARLKATCGGRFAFDFKTSQARMQNGVQLTHHLGELPADEFFGEEVTFELEPPMDRTSGKSSAEMSGIKLKSFEAIGVDSLQNFVGEKWVEFHAPTIKADARAKHLKVDLDRQRIEMDGRINRPNATRSIVHLNYQGTEFRAPRLEYQAAPPGTTAGSRHLGWMLADGPGELTAAADSGMGDAQVRWQESFKMSPAPEAEHLHWIELVGSVLVESKQRGFLTSDRLELWLRDQKQSSPGKLVSNAAGNQLGSRYAPDRVLATGNAVLATDQIRAQVPELDLTIVHVQPSPVGSAGGTAETIPLTDSAGNPMYQWVTAPNAAAPNTAAPNTAAPNTAAPNTAPNTAAPNTAAGQHPAPPRFSAEPGASVQHSAPSPPGSSNLDAANGYSENDSASGLNTSIPLEIPPASRTNQKPVSQPQVANVSVPVTVTGSKLGARLVSTGEDTWVDRLQISGPVRLWRDVRGVRLDASPTVPWHIEGDSLSMTTNPAGQADVQIDGMPAKVVVAEGSLESATIRFDQANNLIWMNQPGEFTIPLTVINAKRGSQNASQVEWFNPPHCTWQGKMIFDGSVANIQGDIEFDGALRSAPNQFWWIKGSSQRMSVSLSSPLNFQSPNQTAVEIAQVQLSENVDIRASQVERTATDVRTISREQIVVPVLDFLVTQNKFIGRGQGWIRSYHLAKNQSTTGSAALGSSPAGLQGVHLKFRDSLVGFMDRKEVVIDGKVELGVAPLLSWEDSIDVDQMQSLQNGQMLLNCDQLNAYDTSHLLAQRLGDQGFRQLPGFGAGSLSSTMPGTGAAPKGAWEFKATGNVAFNGKADTGEFHGRGYQLTYLQAKEQLVLRGDGRSPAQLRRIPTPGSPSAFQGDTLLNVEIVYVNPRTLEVQNMQLGQGGLQWQRDVPATNPGSPFPISTPNPPQSIPNPRQDFYNRNRR